MPRGGYRPGSGRKKKSPELLGDGAGGHTTPPSPPAAESLPTDDPKAFLVSVMNDTTADARIRVDAAKALLSAANKKPEQGKKGEQAEAAAKASSGKFKPAVGPKIVAIR